VIGFVKPLVPKAISVDEWEVFAGAVYGWVYLHRREAMIADWQLERQELEGGSEVIEA